MDLYKPIMDHLRDGSINTPGRNAVEILAEYLGEKLSDVSSELFRLLNRGIIDLGDGTVTHSSYIAVTGKGLRARGSKTPVGRRHKRFAVDQTGKAYRAIATGTPVISRFLTLEEWIANGGTTDSYPVKQDQPKETSVITKTSQVEGNESKALTAQQRKKLEKIDRLKQLLTEELAKHEDGIVLTGEFSAYAATQMSTSIAVIDGYLTLLRQEGFCASIKKELRGRSYLKLKEVLTYEQKLQATLELLRVLKRKRKRGSLRDEVAKLLDAKLSTVDTSYLAPLRHIKAYETALKESGPGYVLAYVQEGPLTEEQLSVIRTWKNEQSKKPRSKSGTTPFLEADASEAPTTPAVASTEVTLSAIPTMDELIELFRGVVARNKELTADYEAVNVELARQVGFSTALEQQLDDLTGRLESSELQLEFALASIAVSSAFPSDLLEAARGIVDKGSSSA